MDKSVKIIEIIKYVDQLKCFEAFSKWAFPGANFYFKREDDGTCTVVSHEKYRIMQCNYYDSSNYLTLRDLKDITGLQRRDRVYLSNNQYKVYKELLEEEFFSDESIE